MLILYAGDSITQIYSPYQLPTVPSVHYNDAVYIDYLTPHRRMAKRGNNYLTETLQRLRQVGMKCHVMCSFLYTEITLLGFVINAEGVVPDQTKAQAIVNLPIPNTAGKLSIMENLGCFCLGLTYLFYVI